MHSPRRFRWNAVAVRVFGDALLLLARHVHYILVVIVRLHEIRKTTHASRVQHLLRVAHLANWVQAHELLFLLHFVVERL